ncbi:MAG: hypothetical protein K2I44_08495, partial [Muribaculaceae bacterium]|nr:hypothetical protein [Muribaculaceae bacterium]
IGDNPELGDKVKITVLASGFDVTLRDSEQKISSGDDKPKGPIVFESKKNLEEEKLKKEASTERIVDFYGSDKVIKQRRTAARMKYAVLKPSQFDDHEVIAMIENSPTFTREPRFNEELQRLSEGGRNVSSSDSSGSERGGETISFGNFMMP